MNHVETYWRDKIVANIKIEKNKIIKEQIGKDIMRDLNVIRAMVDNLTHFQGYIITAKQLIIDSLNRVKSVGTFKQTDTGFEVVNPEGYVAIDSDGNAVKLVNRLQFSQNNFNASKAWSK